MKTKTLFYVMILICNSNTLFASDYYIDYGGEAIDYFSCKCINSGSYEFQINHVPTGYYAEWCVDGQSHEKDTSTFWEDPKFTWNCSGNSLTIEAKIYDKDWSYLENHKWIVTLYVPLGFFTFDVQQNNCGYAYIDWTSSSGATGYTVKRNGSIIATVGSGTTSYTDNNLSGGTYNYCVIAANSCTSLQACVDVSVGSIPTKTNVSGGGSACDYVNLTATGGYGGTIYFQGKNSNGTSTSDPVTSKKVYSSGTYYFRSRSSGGCWGEQGSATVTIKSNSTTPSGISANPSAVCPGGSSNLSVSGGSLGTGATWKWYSGNCGGTYIGSGSTISVSPSSPTTYYVRAEGDCNTTSCANATVTLKSESTTPTGASASPSTICAGGFTTLSVSGGSLGTGAAWKWYSGSCGGTYVGTGSSINVSPSSTTTYYVRAESDCSNTNCANVTVTVKTVSTTPSGATANPSAICLGGSSELSVSGGSLGMGATWKWYSGSCGGTYIGSGSTINVSPSSPTTYYVRAEGDCNITSCANVTVTLKSESTTPTNASASPSTICDTESVTLSVSGGSLGTDAVWEWYSGSCGGTYVGTGSSINVSPSGTTTYYARAESDCSNTNCANVTVNKTTSPSKPGTIQGENNPCANSVKTYAVDPVPGATSYDWTFPTGWSCTNGCNTNSITLVVGEAGGEICARAVNSCGESEYSCLPVTIGGTAPEQPEPISGEGAPCEGSSQTYSVLDVTGATSYTWTTPSGWTGTSSTNSITLTVGSTDGQICVTANNSCDSGQPRCKDVAPVLLPEQPGPISGEETPCEGSSQAYSVSDATGATSYTWSLPSGWSGSSTTNTIAVTVGDGSGKVCVTAVNGCGSSDESCLDAIPVLSLAQPSEIFGDVEPCWDSLATYTIDNDLNAEYYIWGLPEGWSGSSTSNSIDVTVGQNSGNLWVKAVNQCDTSSIRYLDIQSKFCPCIPPGAPSGVSATDGMVSDEITVTWEPVSGASQYIVYRNGDSIVTRPANQSYYTDGSAPCEVVTYYVYSSNGRCKSDTAGSDTGYRLNCSGATSVNNISPKLFSVYPNPATQQLIVELNDISQVPAKIEIYNVLQQVMLNIPVSEGKTQVINISNFKSGLYFIKLSWDGQYVTKKFIIKK